MVALSDFDHLLRAPALLLREIEEINEGIIEKLQTSASTVLVNGLKTCTMSHTIIAVGTIGVFEALLQRHFDWKNSLRSLDYELRDRDQANLADRFRDFRDAINVLKHGKGVSYDRLLSRKDQLPFKVLGEDENFFMEGDVSSVSRLVEADVAFINSSIETIREIIIILDLI